MQELSHSGLIDRVVGAVIRLRRISSLKYTNVRVSAVANRTVEQMDCVSSVLCLRDWTPVKLPTKGFDSQLRARAWNLYNTRSLVFSFSLSHSLFTSLEETQSLSCNFWKCTTWQGNHITVLKSFSFSLSISVSLCFFSFLSLFICLQSFVPLCFFHRRPFYVNKYSVVVCEQSIL
jgi:hypothetical protein